MSMIRNITVKTASVARALLQAWAAAAFTFAAGTAHAAGQTDDPAAPEAVDAEPQRWNAHFQTTYIAQTKDPIAAPYTGANSLLPGREYGWSYSATGGVGFLLRPARGVLLCPG